MTVRYIIDIESRSANNLKISGAYAYSEHPTTQVTHVGYRAVSAPRTSMWRPISGKPMPAELHDALHDDRVVLVAHNAGFERTMLAGAPGRAIGCPAALGSIARWDCTAARAACYGLPRALEDVCEVLELPVTKDRAGHALMMRVCKPRSTEPLTWWDDEERMARMDAYCARDCDAEHALDLFLLPLDAMERRAWQVTEAINDRGIKVDLDLLLAVTFMVDQAEQAMNERISRLTEGFVPEGDQHGQD